MRTAKVYSLKTVPLNPKHLTGRRGHRFCVDLFSVKGSMVFSKDTDTKREASGIADKWLKNGTIHKEKN